MIKIMQYVVNVTLVVFVFFLMIRRPPRSTRTDTLCPYTTLFRSNIKGTLNICQAALDNGVRRVVHTSTSEVYGTAQYVPIDEKHPLQPQSPYSASKIGADAMAMSFNNAFDLPLAIVRPFNTYGDRKSVV